MAHTFGILLPAVFSLGLLWTGCEGLRGTTNAASPQTNASNISHAAASDASDPASLTDDDTPAPANTVNEGALDEAANPSGAETRDEADASFAQFRGTAGRIEKRRAGIAPVVLRSVRTASQKNYDRIVFEFEGRRLPGYHVEYIDRPARQCGSGNPVSLRGDAWLRVRLTPAQAHTEAGAATVNDRERVLNLKLMKELKATCDFEAEVEWVVGLASPNRYRVMELSNPARLVVDVKHSRRN